jgi:glycosyltransferase involved in cell wall biosynthesis
MKILHTESSLGYGGQEMRIVTEAAGLRERGHDVSLLCARGAQIEELARRHGVPVDTIDMARKSLRSVRQMKGYLDARQPALVNTHSSTDSWLVALATRFMSSRPAVVRTRHISAPIPDNITSRWLYTVACDHVVTTGENLRQTLITDNGYPADHVTSVRTGIDLQRFRPGARQDARRTRGLPDDAFIVGIVATLRSWKGHRYLIEAFADVATKDDLLLIVGDGPQWQALHELVDHLGLAQHVMFAGRQQDVAGWLQAMDIFCLPSYANEGVPQALMQSQACGLPAVTTLNGSINEAVIAGRTALIVPPHDSHAIGEALQRLRSDAGLRQRMQSAARDNARKNFSRQDMLDAMENIFRLAIETRSTRDVR